MELGDRISGLGIGNDGQRILRLQLGQDLADLWKGHQTFARNAALHFRQEERHLLKLFRIERTGEIGGLAA